MGAVWEQECAGGWDGHCPGRNTVDGRLGEPRCPDCRESWELDEGEPWRRLGDEG
ncbi:hypothetical protein GCM10010308_64050 [Streptomyces vinaceusdrappus]|nr:hypothetical protein GCM10010308_64050 [Streptomyces vinaceusdrappus]